MNPVRQKSLTVPMKHALVFFICLLSLACDGASAAAQLDSAKAHPFVSKPVIEKLKITPSRETTYFLGPVLPDGTIGYAAALNAHYRKAVTPENDATKILLRILEMLVPDEKIPTDVPAVQGQEPPSPAPRLYLSLSQHIINTGGDPEKELDQARKELDSATLVLWSPSRFPRLAQWIAANQAAFDRVLELPAGKRYFLPYNVNSSPLVLSSASDLKVFSYELGKELIYGLVARATMKAESGDIKGAWEDLMAVRRFASALCSSSSFRLNFFGCMIRSRADIGSAALATSGRLSGAEAKDFLRKLQSELQQTRATDKLFDKMNVISRCDSLDIIMSFARNGPEFYDAYLKDISVASRKWTSTAPSWRSAATRVDWDVVLRTFNEWHDLLVDAARKELRSPSSDYLTTFNFRVQKMWSPVANELRRQGWNDSVDSRFSDAVNLILDSTSQSINTDKEDSTSKQIAKVAIVHFLPHVDEVIKLWRWSVQRSEVTVLAMALAAYKAEHGSSPETLAALSPKYVKQVPPDRFTGKPLKYEKNGNGYLLYGVGRNGKDEGGSDEHEDEGNNEIDDMSVRAASD